MVQVSDPRQIDESYDDTFDPTSKNHEKIPEDQSSRDLNALEGMGSSNYKDTTSSNSHNPDAQRGDIQGREQNPATAIKHISNVTPPITGATNPQKLAIQLMKKGGPIGTVLGIVLLVISFGGSSLSMVIVHMGDQINTRLNHGITSLNERSAALNASRLKGATRGACGEKTLRCRYSTISNKQLKNYEKAAQADPKLKIDTRESAIPGRHVITDITYDGVKIDPSNYRSTLFSNPSFASAMDRVYSPRLATLHDKAARIAQARLKAYLVDPFTGNEADDEARMKKVKGVVEDGNSLGRGRLSETDNADSSDCTTDECLNNKKANQTADAISDAADEVNASDTKEISKIYNGSSQAIGNALKIGVADDLCTAYGTIKALSIAAKVVRSQQLSRMATIIATTGAMIMTDGALELNKLKPEDASFIGDLLTKTYKKEDGTVTKAASDSFGYRWVAYDEIGPVDDNAAPYVIGASFGGSLSGFISTVVGFFGSTAKADSTCRIVNSTLVQGGLLVAGLALLIIPTGAGQGISAGSIAGSVAISVASAILPALLADVVAGKLIDKYTNSEDYANMWVAGAGVLLVSATILRGNIPLKKGQQVSQYLTLTEETNQLYARIDRETLSPFDISSPNTALGSIYSKFIPAFSSIQSGKVYGLMQSVGSIVSSIGSNLFTPALAVDPSARYDHCEDMDVNSIDLAADPFCNLVPGIPVERLQDDPQDIDARLVSQGHSDEVTGKPISEAYKYLVKNCIERTTAWGSTGSDSSSSNGQECLLGESSVLTPLSGISDDLKIDMYLHYQDQVILDGQDNGYDQPQSDTTTPDLAVTGSGSFPLAMPANGPVTSPYGYRFNPIDGTSELHDGTDIGAACGTPLIAAESGTVIESGLSGGWGNRIVIDHGTIDGNQIKSGYNHAESLLVTTGAQVTRGQQIGYVGTTGYSTGCHLHFQLWINGATVDPWPYLSGGG